MFGNIPDGLQQLPSIKTLTIFESAFDSNLSSFLKRSFQTTLEELSFEVSTREQSDEILNVLQNNDLCFRHSLKVLTMQGL